jgi:hypothetical protein
MPRDPMVCSCPSPYAHSDGRFSLPVLRAGLRSHPHARHSHPRRRQVYVPSLTTLHYGWFVPPLSILSLRAHRPSNPKSIPAALLLAVIKATYHGVTRGRTRRAEAGGCSLRAGLEQEGTSPPSSQSYIRIVSSVCPYFRGAHAP